MMALLLTILGILGFTAAGILVLALCRAARVGDETMLDVMKRMNKEEK